MPEWLVGILAGIGGKIGLVIGGAGIALLFPIIKKRLSGLIGSQVGALLDKALSLDTGDSRRNELVRNVVLDLVKLAEYALPNSGAGKERYALAAGWLVRIIPALSGQEKRIAELIEEAVLRMDVELQKRAPQN